MWLRRRTTERERASENQRRLLHESHLAGISILDAASGAPEFAEPDTAALPAGEPLPEIPADQLTSGLLRAGILRDGCVLVRGLVARERAERFAAEIDRAYAERAGGDGSADGYYEEFQPEARFGGVMWRAWIEEGGGLLAADSPRLWGEMMELFEQARLRELVSGYLGEPAVLSVHKTTLRKAEPAVPGAWHQDGSFMGPVRALNLWLALSRCGDEAPGLDIVPRRLESYVATGTEGAELTWTISEDVVGSAAGEVGVVRPIFEPGDALLFDEVFLHKTGSDPAMSKPRFAVESWFFGASSFPADYAPLAV
jgi:Phytanoyl-CoA dioxygenase (PhyH)